MKKVTQYMAEHQGRLLFGTDTPSSILHGRVLDRSELAANSTAGQ